MSKWKQGFITNNVTPLMICKYSFFFLLASDAVFDAGVNSALPKCLPHRSGYSSWGFRARNEPFLFNPPISTLHWTCKCSLCLVCTSNSRWKPRWSASTRWSFGRLLSICLFSACTTNFTSAFVGIGIHNLILVVSWVLSSMCMIYLALSVLKISPPGLLFG